jgi:hypothetical protein
MQTGMYLGMVAKQVVNRNNHKYWMPVPEQKNAKGFLWELSTKETKKLSELHGTS